MRFGIIGCGSIAANSFAPSLVNSDELDLVAVCRRDADKAQEFAERFGGCVHYTSAAALLADDSVEAVVVSTPTVSPYSGWPGVLLCSWRKFLRSSIETG